MANTLHDDASLNLMHGMNDVFIILRFEDGRVLEHKLSTRREVDALIAELTRRANETFRYHKV